MLILKAAILNLFILIPTAVIAWLVRKSDELFELGNFYSSSFLFIGIFWVVLGLTIRVWAIKTFHEHQLRVLSMQPQGNFTMEGLYRHSRNPLYMGIILIVWGAMIGTGSFTGLIFAFLNMFFWHWAALREERQLTEKFGAEYEHYKRSVPLWL